MRRPENPTERIVFARSTHIVLDVPSGMAPVTLRAGSPWSSGHPLVRHRPDLFSDRPPHVNGDG